MKYDVLSTPDLDELCKWVNEKLKKGGNCKEVLQLWFIHPDIQFFTRL